LLSANLEIPKMAYLSDTARVVLAAAAQRDDLSVLPFPDTIKAKGGAEQKVLAGLKKRGFVGVIETPGRPQRVAITREGMAAIGAEHEGEPELAETGPTQADTGATTADACVQAVEAPAPRRPQPTAQLRRPRPRPRRRQPS
jgi:hypothetical protein